MSYFSIVLQFDRHPLAECVRRVCTFTRERTRVHARAIDRPTIERRDEARQREREEEIGRENKVQRQDTIKPGLHAGVLGAGTVPGTGP